MTKIVRRSIAAIVVALLVSAVTLLERDMQRLMGIIVGIASLALVMLGLIHLGKSFSVKAKASALVTTGLYSKIEHPLYFFLDLFLAALIAFLGMPILLPAWGVLVAIHLITCRHEEKILAAAFGVEYESYRSRTWL
jgi:protein-S-isoprenylcysteine O-methyltransferase Ste14